MATQYATQAITITATSLSAGAARQSSDITTDTSVNVNDYRILVKPTMTNTALSGVQAVYVWVYTSEDGTVHSGNAGAADAAITLDTRHPYQLGCVIPCVTNAARGGSFSLKAACGGSLPKVWGIIVDNQTGAAFASFSAVVQKEYNT